MCSSPTEPLADLAGPGERPDGSQAARALHKLGQALRREGRDSEALVKLRKASEMYQELYGGDSEMFAYSLYVIGKVHKHQGKGYLAEHELHDALRIQRAVPGRPRADPRVAMMLNCVAGVYASQGNFAEALEAYSEALEILRGALGPGHVFVANVLHNIAIVLRLEGRTSEALEVLFESLTIIRAAVGKEHPHVALSLQDIGGLWGRQGRYEESLRACEESLRISRNSLGNDHKQVAVALSNLSLRQASFERYPEALAGFQEALRIHTIRPDDPHADSRATRLLINIGDTHLALSRPADALQSYTTSLRACLAGGGGGGAPAGLALYKISVVDQLEGRLREALGGAREAVRISAGALGEGSAVVARQRRQLGKVYGQLGRHAEALESLTTALGVLRWSYGDGSVDVAETRFMMACTHEALGGGEEARALFLECAEAFTAEYREGQSKSVEASRRALC